MTPVQASYYLTEVEHERYIQDCKQLQKSKAAVGYWEALARLRETQGDRKRHRA